MVLTVTALRELHPGAPGPLPSFVDEFQPEKPFVLDIECSVRALRTSTSHSSAGVFGGVFEHYRDVLDPVDPASGFDLFFRVASCVAHWDIPAPVARMLGTSRLVALQKPLGGIRPLAIGEGFYRLVSRAICLRISEVLISHFLWQYGFAFLGGCEVANLGVRLLLESTPSWVVIEVDVMNAFNIGVLSSRSCEMRGGCPWGVISFREDILRGIYPALLLLFAARCGC